MKKELINTDVLIIGTGIAGATTALEIVRLRPKTKVTIITRSSHLNETNTNYAQGGIIALGGKKLVADILKAGDGICLPEAAELLAKEGPKLVENILINTVKVPFDNGFALEGGHSEARVAKVADYTGMSIQDHLSSALLKNKNISILSGFTAIDLITSSHQTTEYSQKYLQDRCLGVYALDNADGKVTRILAKNTVLSTGGNGQLFAYTTNPSGSRGDGVAMSYRAGARILNMEYEQFHPTALKISGAPPFLVSEAVRGEGARLTDSTGKPFMQKYYPELKKPDLATRDKVSRAIFSEMLETGTENVFLDLKNYISKAKIKKHFPVILQTCKKYGIDITRDLVPVSPAAHYTCGGVLTDLNGKTSLNNLYAVGEVSCTGLHGGNRLASTSLLEGLVFGSRAAKSISETLNNIEAPNENMIPKWHYLGSYPADTALIAADQTTIKNIMWNMVGLVRKSSLLERAIRDLTQLELTLNKFYRDAYLTDELIGLRNMSLVALTMAKSAYSNTKSIGCHYRDD